MRAKFLHIADCHLGYWQYHLKERFNDFAKAFLTAIDAAIAHEVDFVLLAGDLFEKRSIDALTLNQAIAGLEKLEAAGIPCLAVEGNHEHAYYRDTLGWMDFLALRNLLILLDAQFGDGTPALKPYDRHRGAYYEPVKGLRVYGLRYLGASAPEALQKYAEAMAHGSADGVEYTVFVTHAGIEGEVSAQMGGLKHSQLAPLKPYVDYVGLGHIHKPYEFEDWIYNPGSLETCAITETQWPDRGYYLVEVDTERGGEGRAKHTATRHAVARRRFYRYSRQMDRFTSPAEFYDYMGAFLERKARDEGVRNLAVKDAPIVEVQLTGVLPFDRSDLDLAYVESLVRAAFKPLHAQVRNLASLAEYAVESGESMSRGELERRVMADLFARDVRFRAQSEHWAAAALQLKRSALEGASPEAIVDELAHQLSVAKTLPEAEDDAEPDTQ